ncbi:transcriptional regulator [Microbacterium oxydans]|uniref:transcriptional regulator n=1 Tax=Microbacterium oxydans TaxID=82380 RepID=UPI00226B8E0C|nr:transcriptional regulator [Microbacterium oxydans]WAA67621.1 transcriptional regulator [Microbacterium oxydans]
MPEQESGSPRLDDDFASALPFSLMAVLQDGADLEFRTLRRILQAERSALSGAILLLENERHVALRRVSFGEMPGTWVAATPAGSAAFRSHLAALRAIVAGAHAGR